MDEIRLAIRRLGQRPGATLASILTLGCSIGAAAATWSLLSAVLLRPLPLHEPERLVVVGRLASTGPDAGTVRRGLNYPLYPQIRDSGIFARVTAEWSPPLSLLVGAGGLPVQTSVAFASHDYFDVLGVRVPLGRAFDAADDRRGVAPVAILADRYWRRVFDAAPDVVGRTIAIAGAPVTVIGVAPRGFRGINLAEAPDLFLPLHTIGDVGSPLTNYFAAPGHVSSPTSGLTIIGRLAADTTIAQVNARLDGRSPPRGDAAAQGTRPVLVPGALVPGALVPGALVPGAPGPGAPGPGAPGRGMPGVAAIDVNTNAIPPAARAGMTQFTRLLGATVGLLLLIGCGTVGMLLLVRTEARRGEFAMCLALGASRARLARGIGVEGALLSLAGAALALPLAWWLFDSARLFQLPGGVQIDLLDLSIDLRAVSMAAGAAVLATLLIALVAGTFGFSADISDAWRSRAGATPRMTRRGTRAVLAAGQVAVALVLLAGAGLFARSLMAALSLNPGFDTARLVTTTISLTPYGYTPARAATFFDDLRERLDRHPAIRAAAVSLPQGGMTPIGKIVIDGVPRQFPTMVSFVAVDDRYFHTVGMRLAAGRDFSTDDRQNAPPVAIVSESFGRAMSNGGTPLGQRITMSSHAIGQPPPVVEVVGVVPDVITNVAMTEPLVIYLPLAQQAPEPGRTYRALTVRATSDAEATAREVMSAIRAIDRAVMPGDILTMEERLGRQLSAQRFGARVLGALGVIAALLTVLGTYVLAESMAILRMREMGIRAALGATRRQLGAIVVAETARLVGLGLLAGLACAWMGSSTIRALLYRVQPLDPATLFAVSTGIFVVSLAVSLRVAVRAARVDLSAVLKAE